MTHRAVKIMATGKYLPPLVVTDQQLAEKLNLPAGWIKQKTGVVKRHYAAGETQAEMAAKAISACVKQRKFF
ncbi:MAG: hypothetical protein LBR56_05035 [Sporomusaceae bacterium]|jgi:3-oxoacyl-[acyl-carrier-protein] synthase-3|nr:hypothetical protein [Sporomusaceae bacterium]